MSIPFTCPHCGQTGKAPDAALNKKAKCPRCGRSFTVEAAGEAQGHTPAKAITGQVVEAEPQQAAPQLPVPVARELVIREDLFAPVESVDEKACPFCGEMVKTAARRCRFCGETIDLALRASEEAERRADDRERRRDRGTNVSTTVIVEGVDRRAFPHGLHLIITLCTCGLWFPIWIIAWLCSD